MDEYRAHGRPYNDYTKPGRKDIDGVEWWACDPYPTWYRWENNELFTNPQRWPHGGLIEVNKATEEVKRLEKALNKARHRLQIAEASVNI